MQKEKVTINQAMFSVVLFNFGSSVVMGVNTDVNQDAWIAILVAALISVPLFFMYSRMLQLFPGKNLFQTAELLFGTVGGKIIAVLFTWYALHLAALVLRNFSEFTQVSTMPTTPQLPIMILMMLTAVYLARSGMAAIGKWSIIASMFILFVVFFTVAASIHQMKIVDLLPILSSPPEKLVKASMQVFAFPFGETVLFLCLGDSLDRNTGSSKMFMRALVIVLIIFLLVFLRNLTLLGNSLMNASYFPSYVTVRIIEVGDFLERIEGSISSNFLLAGIVKITVCLLAAGKGLASIFRLRNGATLLFPVGMLALAFCAMLYHSTMEMFAFIQIYFYYALPFQVILPFIIWIAGEFHARKSREEDEQ